MPMYMMPHQPVYDIPIVDGQELSVSELATVIRSRLASDGVILRTVAETVEGMALVPMVRRGDISARKN